jgi:hypothetical protein
MKARGQLSGAGRLSRAWRDSNPQPSDPYSGSTNLLWRGRLLAWLVNTLEDASIAPVYSLDAAHTARGRRAHLGHTQVSGEAQVISFRPVSRLMVED